MKAEEMSRLLKEAKAKEAARLKLDRESKRLKKEEDGIKAQLMQLMEKAGLPTLLLPEGSASIVEKTRPFIADYTLLEQFIVDNKATDLLQKRLTEAAVRARWEEGIQIPGVGLITEQKLKLR